MIPVFSPITFLSSQPPLICTYVDNKQNTSSPGATHPGMNFGTAAANRYLIAACAIVSSGAITAVDFQGVAGTQLVAVVSSFGSVRTAYWIALVPTGTSGDITVTASPGGISSVALYSAVNLQSPLAFDTDSNFGASPLSMSLSTPTGGVVLATAYSSGTPGPTAAWTGLTTVDLNSRFTAAQQHSAGNTPIAAGGTQNLSVTLSTTNAFSCCAVSLR